MRLKYLYVLLLLPCLIIACNKRSTNEETLNKQSSFTEDSLIVLSRRTASIYDIQFTPVKIGDIVESVTAVGDLDVPPRGRAEVSSFLNGRVTKILVIEGEKIKKGDVLATMESLDLLTIQEDFIKLYLEIPVLEENFKRQEQLYKEEITSKKKFLEAKSILELKSAQLNSLTKELMLLGIDIQRLENGDITDQISIRSPINGSVENISAVLGHFIEPNELLFTVIDPEHLHLELNVFSNEINDLRIKQKIKYRIPSISDNIYIGEVFLITNTLDEEQRSLNVHGHIKDEDKGNFIPGMLVEAEIIISTKSGLLTNEAGISSLKDDYFVFEKIKEDRDKGLYYIRPIRVEYYGIEQGNAQFISNDSIYNMIVSKGAFHLMTLMKDL